MRILYIGGINHGAAHNSYVLKEFSDPNPTFPNPIRLPQSVSEAKRKEAIWLREPHNK